MSCIAVDKRGIEKTLRKHACSNILKISPPKIGSLQIKKKSDIFSYFYSNYRLLVLCEAVLTSTHNSCF